MYEELDVISMKIGLVDYDIEWDFFFDSNRFSQTYYDIEQDFFRRQSFFTNLL